MALRLEDGMIIMTKHRKTNMEPRRVLHKTKRKL